MLHGKQVAETHWKLSQSEGSHLATPRAIERVLRPVSIYPATFARVVNFSAKSIGFHDLQHNALLYVACRGNGIETKAENKTVAKKTARKGSSRIGNVQKHIYRRIQSFHCQTYEHKLLSKLFMWRIDDKKCTGYVKEALLTNTR